MQPSECKLAKLFFYFRAQSFSVWMSFPCHVWIPVITNTFSFTKTAIANDNNTYHPVKTLSKKRENNRYNPEYHSTARSLISLKCHMHPFSSLALREHFFFHETFPADLGVDPSHAQRRWS